MNQVQNIVKEELKFISMDNSFEEFCCKEEEENEDMSLKDVCILKWEKWQHFVLMEKI